MTIEGGVGRVVANCGGMSWLPEGCAAGSTCGGAVEACLVFVLVDLR